MLVEFSGANSSDERVESAVDLIHGFYRDSILAVRELDRLSGERAIIRERILAGMARALRLVHLRWTLAVSKETVIRRTGVIEYLAGPTRQSFYFARLHTKAAAGPPTDGAVLVYLSSSPVIEKLVRFCSVPFQFGNELYSTRRMRSDPLIEYVP